MLLASTTRYYFAECDPAIVVEGPSDDKPSCLEMRNCEVLAERGTAVRLDAHSRLLMSDCLLFTGFFGAIAFADNAFTARNCAVYEHLQGVSVGRTDEATKALILSEISFHLGDHLDMYNEDLLPSIFTFNNENPKVILYPWRTGWTSTN